MKALFISFPASDYAASIAFYGGAVGLTPLRESTDGPHRFTNFDLGGPVLKIFEWTEPWHGKGHSGLFIETADLDEVVERIRASEGEAMDIVVHAWGGRCCTVRDPFGNLFDLIDSDQKGDA
jgi:predicted enzyme related to lactoylglutathione lyase